jgi:prepilin-type N-terminal cleavage/methylation domain-containing protein
MSSPRRLFCPARSRSGKGGFTLVELLVVIAIIALLAGIAIGPITGALKTAKDNGGMQTTHSLYIADFQYSIDNSTYPNCFADGADGGAVANALLNGGYITDPTIFWQGGKATKPVAGQGGGNGKAASLTAANVSWDFMGYTSGSGLSSNDPDQVPLIWSTGNTLAIPPSSGETVTVGSDNPFGTDGIPVVYKSGQSKFQKASITTGTIANFVDTSYTAPTPPPTYQIEFGAK